MIIKILKALAILLFIGFSLFSPIKFIQQFPNIWKFAAIEPADKAYITDERRYLKTYYLMKRGYNFYQASLIAFQKISSDNDEVWRKDMWGWRLPLIFYIWLIFSKNGQGIIILFNLLSLITIYCAYLLSRKLISNNIAIFGSLMLIPYFLNALITTNFLFIEWWALFFFIFGLTALFYKKKLLVIIFFSLSLMVREHYAIPIFLMFISSFIFKKNYWLFFIPLFILLINLIFHYYQITHLISLTHNLAFSQRIVFFNKSFYLATVAFSTNSYLLTNLRPTVWWFFFSFLGLIYCLLTKRKKYLHYIALISFLSLMLAYCFMGQSQWENYWGILYVPLLIIFSPIIIKSIDDKN